MATAHGGTGPAEVLRRAIGALPEDILARKVHEDVRVTQESIPNRKPRPERRPGRESPAADDRLSFSALFSRSREGGWLRGAFGFAVRGLEPWRARRDTSYAQVIGQQQIPRCSLRRGMHGFCYARKRREGRY
jgi:hypothetical protein